MRTLLTALAVLTLAACGQSQKGYTEQYRFGVVSSCMQQPGATAAICNCYWDRIEAELPRAEFDAYERMTPAQRDAAPLKARLASYGHACAAAHPPQETETPAP